MFNLYKKHCQIIVFILLIVLITVPTHNQKNNEFLCEATIYYLKNRNGYSIEKYLKFLFSLHGGNKGFFDIYGYSDGVGSKGSVEKISRRIHFTYTMINDSYYLKMNKTERFNSDNSNYNALPEFISSQSALLNIERIGENRYLIYDHISPEIICSTS